VTEIKERIAAKDEQTNQMEQELGNIKDNVKSMVGDFSKSKFFLSVAQNMHYDDQTQFNEGNVTMYLGELEEYISQLITFMAYQQNNQDAAISSLSLDRMHNKEFDKG
jgi:hypothetical protein